MIVIEVRGDGVRRMMNKLEKKIPGTKKKILQEFGMKTKKYAQDGIISSDAITSGTLLKSIHYRTMPEMARIWSDAGHSVFWETGVKPHFVHRRRVGFGGYTVGDWMDAKGMNPNRQYLWVGGGFKSGITPIGKGIHFMRNSFRRIKLEVPYIVDKYARMILK